MAPNMAHKHPTNVALREQSTRGDRAARKVASVMGSWRFIAVQTFVIICWITLNVTAVVAHWDAYPFILLNLLFSTQAAYAAPILQLASNQAAEHDRLKAEADYETNARALAGIKNILLLLHGETDEPDRQ